jgi:predicted CXXCH cytochrome family protein
MFHAGVTCTNCHEPHTATLRAQGNSLCAQCHMPQKFDVAEHHHHKPDSSGAQCVNCHMPAKTYMGVDLRRDHSFRVPRPDLTVKIGVPNTCTQCHADRSADWAAKTIAAWFPDGRQATSHYGLALHAGRTGLADTEAQLDALIHDTNAPAIARASALQALPPYATAASEPAVAASVSDPEPLVRLAAPAMLGVQPSQTIAKEITSLLSDPVRAVRIQAARALAGVDPRTLTPAQQSAYDSAYKELVAAEMINADRPEVHLNLGLLAVRRGQGNEAEAQYQTALRLDQNFVPAMVNLADLDRMRGMDQQGAALLRKAIAIEPGNADAHHAFGLLLVRQHDPAAMAELRQANELAPDNARYAYVYAVALNSTGADAPAMALLERTHQQHPADRNVLVALVSIAQRQGDQPTALRHARELAALEPNDEQVRRLVQQLSGAVPH